MFLALGPILVALALLLVAVALMFAEVAGKSVVAALQLLWQAISPTHRHRHSAGRA